ncbi:hypothetical protein F5Y18DRAFT_427071 [Xylariaceae sp. FL1019]|nr:hypothetical protein F5Y18DRAFT_427071 [Xylariaceae sp. FL1019]
MCCFCYGHHFPCGSQIHQGWISTPPPPYPSFSPLQSDSSSRSFGEYYQLPESLSSVPTHGDPVSFPAGFLDNSAPGYFCPRALELPQFQNVPPQGQWSCPMTSCPRRYLLEVETMLLYLKSCELLDENRAMCHGSHGREIHKATKKSNASSSRLRLGDKICQKSKTIWRRIRGRDLLCLRCSDPINNCKGTCERIDNWELPTTPRWNTPDDVGQVSPSGDTLRDNQPAYAELPTVADPSELWSPISSPPERPPYLRTEQWAVGVTHPQLPEPCSTLSSPCANQGGYLPVDVTPSLPDQSGVLCTTGHPIEQSAVAVTNDHPGETQGLETGNQLGANYTNHHAALYDTFANFCYSPQRLYADGPIQQIFNETTTSPSSSAVHPSQSGYWQDENQSPLGIPQNPAEMDGINCNSHCVVSNNAIAPERSSRSQSTTSYQVALPTHTTQAPCDTPGTIQDSNTSEDECGSCNTSPSGPNTSPASSTSSSSDSIVQEPVVKCSVCGWESGSSKTKNHRAYVRKHKKKHDAQKTMYPCPHCDKTFTRRDNRRAHIRKCHDQISDPNKAETA